MMFNCVYDLLWINRRTLRISKKNFQRTIEQFIFSETKKNCFNSHT